MMKAQPGFTLVEMMAVIAVITILALMAVPSYLDRIIKAQIEAAMPLADLAKRPIATFWDATRTFPADNALAALPAADKIVNNYVSALTVQDGVINITFGNRANKAIAGKIISLRPAIVEDAPMVPITWVCGLAEAPDKMTVTGTDQTNVDVLYLPMDCRKLKKQP
jgi:type IV pilus assembly protein PilA